MRLINADHLNEKMIPNCPIEEGGIPLPDFATHIKILEMYPTVDAVPVAHGRWIRTCNIPMVNKFTCSVCGNDSLKGKYCPNCGAKMDGENDNV